MDSKPCRKCGETKPLDLFPKHPTMRDGRLHECKACRALYMREHLQERTHAFDELPATGSAAKPCSACGVTKALELFPAHAFMKDGRLNRCKECQAAYAKEHHGKNQKKHNAQAKQWRLDNPERARDLAAAWRGNNPERWREIARRADKKARTNGTAARSREGRTARKAATGTGAVSLVGIYRKYGRHCSICDKPIELQSEATIDHVIPLARGGTHTDDNLRPAHHRCNAWKSDRLPEELVGLVMPPPGEQDEWQARRQEKVRKAQSAASSNWFATATPEMKAARAAKISAAKLGRKHPPGSLTGGARERTPETALKAAATNKNTWANKTPEERAAWIARCKERFNKPAP